MNRINEMIRLQEYKNVKRIKLKDCCSAIFSGGTPLTSKEQYYDGNIPWIRSGEIDFNRIFRSERNISQEGLENSSAKLIRPKSVVMAMTGATVAKVATIEAEMAANQSVCALETNSQLDYRFLYFYLATKYLQLRNSAQGALTSLNLERIKNIEIPLPPLNIQKEIVSILDSFTSLIDKMKQEVEMRKKQMEYYREKLLAPQKSWEIKTLGEIGTFTRGNGLQKSDFRDKGFPCVHYGQIHTYYKTCIYKTKSFCEEDLAKKLQKASYGDLLIATTSEDVKACCKAAVWFGDGDVAYSGDSFRYSHDQNPKYMAYLFQTEMFAKQKQKAATGAKVVRVSGESMASFSFAFPPLAQQRQIASILDTFETYISKLEQMIELRQKQYEYYREKLLTFE